MKISIDAKQVRVDSDPDGEGAAWLLTPQAAKQLAEELMRVADAVEKEAGRKNLKDIDSAAGMLVNTAESSMRGLTVRDHSQVCEMLKAVVAFRDYVHNETCMYDD